MCVQEEGLRAETHPDVVGIDVAAEWVVRILGPQNHPGVGVYR